MQAKFFSYKVEGITLEPVNNNVQISNGFDKKDLLTPLKEILKEQGFKIDAATIDYKIMDGGIVISGMAVEEEQPRSIGFMTGK